MHMQYLAFFYSVLLISDKKEQLENKINLNGSHAAKWAQLNQK